MIYCALDIGNVLVLANFEDFIKKLSKTLNITIEEANYFMNRTQKLHDLGLTNMSDELRDHFKIKSPVTIEELIFHWNQVILPNTYIMHLLNELSRDHDIKVALVSNVGLEHAVQMEKTLGFSLFFKEAVKFFSCHVGARKPTLLYYHLFLELHPEFKGCVYVDDLAENLEASKQFGFKTFQFSLEEATKRTSEYDKLIELKKILIESDPQPLKKPRRCLKE